MEDKKEEQPETKAMEVPENKAILNAPENKKKEKEEPKEGNPGFGS